MRRARILALAPLIVANAASSPAPRSPSATHDIAQATVDVGHVFQTGQTDGLILYALILSDAMMLLICITLVVSVFRHIAKAQVTTANAFAAKDKVNADQTVMFVAAMDRFSESISTLAVSVANNLQADAAAAVVLARLERTDGELMTLLRRLNRVD